MTACVSQQDRVFTNTNTKKDTTMKTPPMTLAECVAEAADNIASVWHHQGLAAAQTAYRECSVSYVRADYKPGMVAESLRKNHPHIAGKIIDA